MLSEFPFYIGQLYYIIAAVGAIVSSDRNGQTVCWTLPDDPGVCQKKKAPDVDAPFVAETLVVRLTVNSRIDAQPFAVDLSRLQREFSLAGLT